MAFIFGLRALLFSAYVLGGLLTSCGLLIAISSDHFGRSCPHFFVAEAVFVFTSYQCEVAVISISSSQCGGVEMKNDDCRRSISFIIFQKTLN